MKFKEYSKTLPKAERIFLSLYPEKPKSHKEWVDKINRIGDINKILIDEN